MTIKHVSWYLVGISFLTIPTIFAAETMRKPLTFTQITDKLDALYTEKASSEDPDTFPPEKECQIEWLNEQLVALHTEKLQLHEKIKKLQLATAVTGVTAAVLIIKEIYTRNPGLFEKIGSKLQ